MLDWNGEKAELKQLTITLKLSSEDVLPIIIRLFFNLWCSYLCFILLLWLQFQTSRIFLNDIGIFLLLVDTNSAAKFALATGDTNLYSAGLVEAA